MIKFKAYNQKDNEMYSDEVAKLLLYRESIGEAMPDYFKILRFTGRTDKRGTEIYEGDIIEFNESDKLKNGSFLRLTVAWIENNQYSKWGFIGDHGQEVHLSFTHVQNEEVIGNSLLLVS